MTSLIILVSALILSSCNPAFDVPGSLSNEGKMQELLEIAWGSDGNPAMRYAALEPVISSYRSAGETDALCTLLGEILSQYPGDPYGAYYLMAMAEGAMEAGSTDLALDYMRRLLKNYPNLNIKGRSLHLLAMGEIAKKTPDTREAIKMRLEMQRRFGDQIDPGRNMYALAQEYRKIGDWERMYEAYENFLKYPNTGVPGVPDARSIVLSDLAFHQSDKSWTMKDLNDLVGSVKYAIRTQDARLLTRYQAEQFFLMNWSQETSDSFTHIPMTLGSFLKSSVRYKSELEAFSNDREAYLWTAGWSWKIPTWYLYFRRVDYPADPEINGRWEWAGIYFGERL